MAKKLTMPKKKVPSQVLEYLGKLALTPDCYSDDEVLFDLVEIFTLYPDSEKRIKRAIVSIVHRRHLILKMQQKMTAMKTMPSGIVYYPGSRRRKG